MTCLCGLQAYKVIYLWSKPGRPHARRWRGRRRLAPRVQVCPASPPCPLPGRRCQVTRLTARFASSAGRFRSAFSVCPELRIRWPHRNLVRAGFPPHGARSHLRPSPVSSSSRPGGGQYLGANRAAARRAHPTRDGHPGGEQCSRADLARMLRLWANQCR